MILRVRLRLGLELGGKTGHQRAGFGGRARRDEDARREEPNLHGFAVGQCLVGGRDGGAASAVVESCV